MIYSIAAMDRSGCIGAANSIPWRCKFDMQFFVRTTTDKIVIMGRNTWNSLPKRPLKNRTNVVLSNYPSKVDELDKLDWCTYDIDNLYKRFPLSSDFYVIGGAQVYESLINQFDVQYVSIIETDTPNGDAYYPLSPDEVKERGKIIAYDDGSVAEANGLACTIYEIRK